ncbi:homing endonuclease associated repeat-containing protein [Natrinema salsiterrestre]|uniref:Helix-hairpin-helix domain-containing protein n=1 Tax=Natrinema salsiterrestre TaxID=2950540 RepID=A0A9Q4L132_9EURY|nr:helix-hairpin-helix domain-containing protein [Natrinema salsiterrestre]MDF9747938.1 helix-hairpin-helix domain-containing protein [Natrinema salsiterrestre]
MARLPTASEVNDQCRYTHQEYREVFGSLVTAYKQAGIVPEDVSEAELTTYATGKSSDKNGSEAKSTSDTSPPSSASSGQEGANTEEVTAHSGVSSKLEKPATQEQTKDRIGQVEVTEDALVKEIQRFAEIIDEPPTEELVISYGEYESTAYETVFESWDQTLEEAGFNPADVPDWSDRKYTNAEILGEISDLAEELGHPPTTTEMNKYGDVTGGIGSLRFGSWANAISLAGLDSDERSSIQKATAASDGQSGSSTADSEGSAEEITGTSEPTDANAEESSFEELTSVSGVLKSDAIALAEAGYASRKALKEASADDLQKVEKINLQLALRIKADVEE